MTYINLETLLKENWIRLDAYAGYIILANGHSRIIYDDVKKRILTKYESKDYHGQVKKETDPRLKTEPGAAGDIHPTLETRSTVEEHYDGMKGATCTDNHPDTNIQKSRGSPFDKPKIPPKILDGWSFDGEI